MPPTPECASEERILILAPRGRDADVIASALQRDGFGCETVAGFAELIGAIDLRAGAAVIAEEALLPDDIDTLLDWLQRQEAWSDFPFVVLVSKPFGATKHSQHTQHTRLDRLAELGNIILLERPLNAQTLRSAASSALRGRHRQYQAQQALAERAQTAHSLELSKSALVLLNETLETRIEERTRALALANDRLMNEGIERERVQQALVQFQKMEAVGRLTGGIAHDFNNLLNVIQGSMDLILFMSKDDLARRKAEVARRACERGGKLTSQLLAFSRNQKLDLRATDVHALFDGVRELISASLGSNVELVFEIDQQIEFVMADLNQMEMALLNLAINARDAMPHGGRLTMRAALATPPPGLLPAGQYGLISVSDNGDGVAADVIAKVFDPFFTTKGVGKGTGLGLSQVYGMAQQSGGIARMLNGIEHGQTCGVTVEIWLRCASADSADELAETAPEVLRSVPQSAVRILVVEDDKFVRQSMVEMLEALGYQVTQAADGQAGLLELRQQKPHLMITDYLMPGMTGAELIAHANREFPGLPMIIVTGYADMQAIDQVIGDNVVLRKPFRLIELAASVDRALSKTAQAAPA